MYVAVCGIACQCYLLTEYGGWGFAVFWLRLLWPIVLLYGVYLFKGLGAGDIKLLAVISTLFEIWAMLWIILVALAIGAIYGGARLLWKRKFSLEGGEKIRFSGCILLACICYFIKGGCF